MVKCKIIQIDLVHMVELFVEEESLINVIEPHTGRIIRIVLGTI